MVTCRDCGDVVVMITQCQLRRCDDDSVHSLAYRCPGCGCRDVVGQLHVNEIVELLDAGMSVVPWQRPREVHEARYAGPTVILDDLLDFHLLLEHDDWWRPLLDH
jgi:hypothetical protein